MPFVLLIDIYDIHTSKRIHIYIYICPCVCVCAGKPEAVVKWEVCYFFLYGTRSGKTFSCISR